MCQLGKIKIKVVNCTSSAQCIWVSKTIKLEKLVKEKWWYMVMQKIKEVMFYKLNILICEIIQAEAVDGMSLECLSL